MCNVVCKVFLCFFFFKQKTAYEMRISDWSSDVCSSDLIYAKAYRKQYWLPATQSIVRQVSAVIPFVSSEIETPWVLRCIDECLDLRQSRKCIPGACRMVEGLKIGRAHV